MQTSDDERSLSCAALLTMTERGYYLLFLSNNTESMKRNIWFIPENRNKYSKGQ